MGTAGRSVAGRRGAERSRRGSRSRSGGGRKKETSHALRRGGGIGVFGGAERNHAPAREAEAGLARSTRSDARSGDQRLHGRVAAGNHPGGRRRGQGDFAQPLRSHFHQRQVAPVARSEAARPDRDFTRARPVGTPDHRNPRLSPRDRPRPDQNHRGRPAADHAGLRRRRRPNKRAGSRRAGRSKNHVQWAESNRRPARRAGRSAARRSGRGPSRRWRNGARSDRVVGRAGGHNRRRDPRSRRG